MASARELYQDLQASIMGNQETSYNKLGSESKGLIKDIQKIDGGSLKDIYMKGMPSNYEAGGPVVNPTTAMPEAPMSGLANLMAMKGRDNDSMLVHLSPTEVSNLNKLSGNTMTINPATGLPEGRSRFLEAALPALLSIGVGIATGGATLPAQIAAQAATGYGSARLTGKDHDEALTSGLVSGATAGLLGGTGTAGLDTAAKTGPIGLQHLQNKGLENLGKGFAQKSIGELASSAFVPSNLLNDVTKKAIQDQGLKALANPALAVPHLTQFAMKTGANAAVDQMRADANYVPPIQEDMSKDIDIYSTPFTQTSMGPFNQQQIADNFISGGSGPYGMNYLNQAYGQQGGQVQEMNQGGLTQFNSIMGNPALQLQNPNPPMQMAGGGMMGEVPPEMLQMLQSQVAAPQDTKSYDVLASIGANPVQAMAGGGMAGAGQGQASIMQALQPMLQVANQQAQQAVQQPMQMKAGGNLGNYIPSVGIIGGLLDSLRSKKKDTSPNITNNYYGTGPDGQPMLMDGPPQQIPLGNPIQMAGGGLSGLQESASDVKNKFFSSPLISPLLKTLGKDPDKFGPKGSSQGGKGKTIRGLVDDVNEQKLQQQKQPTQKMNQGGMTQFNSIMGNPALQLQNPNPPMQMGLGGWVSETLGLGGSGSASAGGPKGSSQGGKGSGNFSEMLNSPEVKAMFQQQGVGVDGSTGTDQFAQLSDNPVQQMAGGGMMGDIPPEMLEMLKSQVSAPAPVKGYDVLADINNNPMQQMNQGGMTGAGQSRASLMQALQPMLQVANQQSQQPVQMARGKRVSTDIVEGLRAIADGAAFEGKVEGAGDGMSDDIPFMIEGEQPALLARDEYVIPADVVAMVGNGSSNAGAEQFDQFLNNIRQTKYGRTEQPRETQGLEALLG